MELKLERSVGRAVNEKKNTKRKEPLTSIDISCGKDILYQKKTKIFQLERGKCQIIISNNNNNNAKISDLLAKC